MEAAKKALTSAKNFVSDHKVAIAVATTAAITMVVTRKTCAHAYDVADKFITEKGLADEFLEYVPNVTN